MGVADAIAAGGAASGSLEIVKEEQSFLGINSIVDWLSSSLTRLRDPYPYLILNAKESLKKERPVLRDQ